MAVVAETVTVGRTEYAVERTGDENLPYKLSGPRGARYSLMRNVPNPTMLFAINAREGYFGVVERVGWFTDKRGVLESVR